MKRLAGVLAALAGVLLCASARSETLYVIEQLIVSVSSTADESGERIASIHSGDSVQVLEHHDSYTRIRLPSGTEGWVKASYLSAQQPLQTRLAQESAQVAELKQEISRLQDAASAVKLASAVARDVPPDPPAAAADEHRDPPRPIWQWTLGFSLLALIGGFALGWRVLDNRIRRKYGGLRIY